VTKWLADPARALVIPKPEKTGAGVCSESFWMNFFKRLRASDLNRLFIRQFRGSLAGLGASSPTSRTRSHPLVCSRGKVATAGKPPHSSSAASSSESKKASARFRGAGELWRSLETIPTYPPS
jgi:hypothetical protein